MADVLVKQVRSAAGSSPRQRDTLRTLRLGRIGKTVVRAGAPLPPEATVYARF